MSVSSAASATSGNLLAAQFAQPVSTTTVAATAASAASSYQQSYQSLLAADAQELLTGAFSTSSALDQPSAPFGSEALIQATTSNTIDVLSQFASLQDVGYQTAATAQLAATTAAAQAAAQNKQDNAVLAAPIDPVDPYAALGSADPLNLLGLTVDTTA
jgi:hypothetical protein